MPIYEINSFTGLSDYPDRGIRGAFKFGYNLDVRKLNDTLSAGQALVDEGLTGSPSSSVSPSASQSPSASPSPTASPSASSSPSSSVSRSPSASSGTSDSPSRSPSASASPSASTSPSHSNSPSPSPSAGLSTVYEDLVLWFVKANDGYVYEFGNTGIIYRRDSAGTVVRVYKDPDGKIKGASEWYSDSNKTYLYWTTDVKLHRKELPGRSDWNDVDTDTGWPKANLNSTDWHTMGQAGGALMIANKNWLAMVGYDDSYTNKALDLIPGNYAKTIVERNGRTIVGSGRASDPNKSINAAIDSEVPLAQVGDDGELYFANMSDNIPVRRFPGGGKVNPGGVCNKIDQVNFFEWEQTALSWIDKQSVGNLSLWGVYSADSGKNGVYSYGRNNKNFPFTLNLDHYMDVDEIGAVTSVDGTTLISYRDGSSYGVKASDPDGKTQAVWEGLELKSKNDKSLGDATDWTQVEIYCEPLPDGSSIEFQYKLDKDGDWHTALMEPGSPNSTKFQARDETKAVFLIGEKADIFEPRIIINPTGNTSPEIHRVRLFFE